MYFRILETFLLKIIFSKDEYNIASKSFNPVKFTVILLLVANVPFTIFLVMKFHKFFLMVQKMCPAVLS